MPRITIGMPVYNGGALLGGAITALEAQTHAGFAVLAADNASTDGTADALAAWATRDGRVTVHRHDANIGALANFRYVLERAETEYFMWHACDDWADPNYIEALRALLDSDPHCALAVGDVVKTTPDGGEKRRVFPDLAGRSRLGRVVALLKRPRAPWIYGLFRTHALRRAFADAGDFGYAWGSDYVTLLPFILEDRIRGTGAAAFHYRMADTATRPYRPRGRLAHLRFFGRYLGVNVAIFGRCGLSPLEKAACLPVLLRHVARAIR